MENKVRRFDELKDWLTPRQVADHYDVPIARVYSAIKDGRIEGRKAGWGVLINRNTLPERWPGRVS